MFLRARSLLRSGIDTALLSRGYSGADLDQARVEVANWARTRVRAPRDRRGVVAGLGVVVTRPGTAELQPFEVPLAGPDQVTVEILVSALSPGTERAQWLRLPHARPTLPFRPGYSGAGRVIAVGGAVTSPTVGDIVAVPRARHASVVTVPASWVVKVPPGVSLEQAALVYLAIIAGYGVRRAALVPGEPLCVLGAGPIGALAGRLALHAGSGDLTVVASTRRREKAMLAAGASDFRVVGDGVSGIDAPVVIEATGDPGALTAALGATRVGGTVVLLGSSRGTSPDVPLRDVQRRSLRLIGAHVSALATEIRASGTDVFTEIATTFLDAVATGAVDVSDLVGDGVDPRELGLFYQRLARGDLTTGHLDWRRVPAAERRPRHGLLAGPLLPRTGATVAAPPVPALRVTTRRLRFAAIGCGDIGEKNARAVARATNADLVILHDAVPALAAAAARSHGGRAVETVDEALDPTSVDAVFLSVPHDLHAPLTLRATERGLHVVVEKPLAIDLATAQEIADAVARADVALSVCFPYRYEPAPTAARALAAAGALGEFRGAAVVFHADKPQSYWKGGFSGRATSDWRRRRDRSGGGVMIMNLTHHIDLLRHITGCEIASVSAVCRTEEGDEIEDAVAVTVGFVGGGIGTLIGSASTRGAPRTRFEVWGDTGTAQLEPEPRIFTTRAVDGVLPNRWNDLPVAPPVDERTVFVERFAAAALAGESPDVTIDDALAVQAVVDAVYRSAREGRPVDVLQQRTIDRRRS